MLFKNVILDLVICGLGNSEQFHNYSCQCSILKMAVWQQIALHDNFTMIWVL